MSSPKYCMTLNLNILNHLGLNLYSNVPAVLSEVVANSWDADAEIVNINITDKTITIKDDGEGMNLKDINEKFLTVGYQRREHGEATTKKHDRRVMGRKGIGKLSLFSIANTIEVQSANADEIDHSLPEQDDQFKPDETDHLRPEQIDHR